MALREFVDPRLASLIPHHIKGRDGLKVVVDQLTEKQIPAVYAVIRRIMDGRISAIPTTHFATEDKFRTFLSSTVGAFSVKDKRNDNIIGFINVTPHSSCRSALPICARGYVIQDPMFHRKGFFPSLVRFQRNFAIAAGHLGIVGNIPEIYRHIRFPRGLREFSVTCTVPRGVHLRQTGWTDDLLIFTDLYSYIPDKCNISLGEEEVISRALESNWTRNDGSSTCDIHMAFSVNPPGVATARVQKAKETELGEVYDILNSAARKADGFGVDEFPSFAIFKGNFLSGKSLHVIVDEHTRTLMGAVIAGQSHITRGNPNYAMVYMYLLPGYRRRGYGTLIERAVTQYLQERGFEGVLTDILLTDSNAFTFAARASYINIGFVPRSAYVTKQGWTDSAVTYKLFDVHSVKSQL